MSYFTLSDGQSVNADGSMEMGGGTFPPIPANTNVLAAADEAKWDSYEGDEYISIRWNVLKPAEYANRKVFQKLRVEDSDAAKRDKAIRMLAAIDANAGGKLAATGQRPTDQSLSMSLLNRPMVLKLDVWEFNDKSGNWVQAVSPRNAGQQQQQAAPVQNQVAQAAPADDFDSVPF